MSTPTAEELMEQAREQAPFPEGSGLSWIESQLTWLAQRLAAALAEVERLRQERGSEHEVAAGDLGDRSDRRIGLDHPESTMTELRQRAEAAEPQAKVMEIAAEQALTQGAAKLAEARQREAELVEALISQAIYTATLHAKDSQHLPRLLRDGMTARASYLLLGLDSAREEKT